VFFRKASFDEVEAQRQRIMRAGAIRLQATIRRFQGQTVYLAKRKVVRRLQAIVRGHAGRKVATGIRRTNASTRVQAFARRSIARCRYVRMRKAVIRLQVRAMRLSRCDLGCYEPSPCPTATQARKRGINARVRVLALRKDRAATFFSAAFRRHCARRMFLRQRKAAIRLQVCCAAGLRQRPGLPRAG
jgi:myosin heavy subunit